VLSFSVSGFSDAGGAAIVGTKIAASTLKLGTTFFFFFFPAFCLISSDPAASIFGSSFFVSCYFFSSFLISYFFGSSFFVSGFFDS